MGESGGWAHLARLGRETDTPQLGSLPTEDKIVTGSWDSTAIVWDARTGDELSVLRGHTSARRSVAIFPPETILSPARWTTPRLSGTPRQAIRWKCSEDIPNTS